jgi:hypothetical protein
MVYIKQNKSNLLKEYVYIYLFCSKVGGSYEAVALAYNSGVLATSNGIHKPMSVVIVNHMDETPSASWHPLHQTPSEMVECHCDLHYRITLIAVTCAEQHHLHAPISQNSYIYIYIYIYIYSL